MSITDLFRRLAGVRTRAESLELARREAEARDEWDAAQADAEENR